MVPLLVNNDMLKRPRSALFTPSRSTSARSVFNALSAADINASDVQCLQRKLNGEVVITFKSDELNEKFLCLDAIAIENDSYAIQDIDRPLTFLTVYDVPFELSDWAIIKRPTPFCEVVNYRRGNFDFECAPMYQAISAMCEITKFVLIVRTLAMRLTTVQLCPCAIFVMKMVTLAVIALTPGLHPSSVASLRMRLHPSWWMTMVMMAQSLVNPVRHTQMIPSDGLMSQISLTPMLTL